MRALDTTEDAEAAQIAVWRCWSPGRRAEVALGLGDHLRRLARDGVRGRHPEYTDEQLDLAVLRLVLGEDLYRRAYPGRPIVPA